MNEKAFFHLLRQLKSLSPSQWLRLHERLEQHEASAVEALLSDHEPRHCPYCHSTVLRLWGSSHGLPRYRCRSCDRTSNPLTNTPLAGLRKRDQWLRFSRALIDGRSIRSAAAECGVNKNTAFLWRHRFLALAAEYRADHEHGIVEA